MIKSSIRKQRSLEKIKAKWISYYELLPEIGEDDEFELQNLEDIINRIYAFSLIAWYWGMVASRDILENFKEVYNVVLSQREQDFWDWKIDFEVNRYEFDENFEAMYVLAWCVGLIEDFKEFPTELIDIFPLMKIVNVWSIENFNKTLKIKSKSEILDYLDLVYRLDWAVVESSYNDEINLWNINRTAIYQRHLALNWICSKQYWDDVSVDT